MCHRLSEHEVCNTLVQAGSIGRWLQHQKATLFSIHPFITTSYEEK